MAENKMKEVAKLLGVELEEEFKIKGFVNKCKLSTYGLMCWSDTSQDWVLSSAIGELLNGLDEIVKLHEPQKPILDKEEKEYLSAMIKPFRNRIIYIMKTDEDDRSEFIEIRSKHYDVNKIVGELIMLPSFKKGTMYKNMKTDKKYTLKELGL